MKLTIKEQKTIVQNLINDRYGGFKTFKSYPLADRLFIAANVLAKESHNKRAARACAMQLVEADVIDGHLKRAFKKAKALELDKKDVHAIFKKVYGIKMNKTKQYLDAAEIAEAIDLLVEMELAYIKAHEAAVARAEGTDIKEYYLTDVINIAKDAHSKTKSENWKTRMEDAQIVQVEEEILKRKYDDALKHIDEYGLDKGLRHKVAHLEVLALRKRGNYKEAREKAEGHDMKKLAEQIKNFEKDLEY